MESVYLDLLFSLNFLQTSATWQITSMSVAAHRRHAKRWHWRHPHSTHRRWRCSKASPNSWSTTHAWRSRQGKRQQLGIHVLHQRYTNQIKFQVPTNEEMQ